MQEPGKLIFQKGILNHDALVNTLEDAVKNNPNILLLLAILLTVVLISQNSGRFSTNTQTFMQILPRGMARSRLCPAIQKPSSKNMQIV